MQITNLSARKLPDCKSGRAHSTQKLLNDGLIRNCNPNVKGHEDF